MRTIRRLYFYLVAFISLEVVTWGLIGLLRSIVSSVLVDMPSMLARALALVVVGTPIFLFHWQWGQRAATAEVEERTAMLRALFYYAALLATLLPVVQNILALVNRVLLLVAHLDLSRALVGASQSWEDNLIAIGVNGLLAAWLSNALSAAWQSLPNSENFSDVRRLYRYLWLLYGVGMTVFGAQQTLRFIFDPPINYLILGGRQRSLFNGLALLLVGTPLWAYTWHICQDALSDGGERDSNLRLGALYLLTLGGAISALAAGGTLLDVLLRRLLGEAMTTYELTRRLGGPFSVGLPFVIVWAYYHGWLAKQIHSDQDARRQANKKRFYNYLLATVGLGVTFTGLSLLLSFIVDLLVSHEMWGGTLRLRLATALSTLVIGLPVWLASWRPMQAEVLEDSPRGEEARRAPLRRAYLYLALFAGVIGGMVSAIWLVYTLLVAVFSQQAGGEFLSKGLNAVQSLALFAVLLLYHQRCLQRDGAQMAKTLEARRRAFPIAVLDGGNAALAEQVRAALQRHAPSLSFSLVESDSLIHAPEAFKALILPATLALNSSPMLRRWLDSFAGEKILIATEPVPGWVLSALTPDQAAQVARQLAEGQRVRLARPSNVWTTIQLVAVVVVGLQLLSVLLSVGILLLTG